MDLFHYSSPGVRDFSGTQAGYFSLDNGATNLNNFNTNPGGDFGDWASSAGNDAGAAYSRSSVVNAFSATDIQVMDAIGWDTGSGEAADTTPPILLSTSPADDATNVALGANVVLTFSEAVKAGSGNVAVHRLSDGGTVLNIAITDAAQVSVSGAAVTVNPASDLSQGTGYYVTLDSGAIQDLAGNGFSGISTSTALNFTTVPAVAALTSAHASYDLNGDGRSDILWQHDNGQPAIWLMNGLSVASMALAGSINPGPTWDVKAADDFNADGKADILWQNDNGQPAIWMMNGATATSMALAGSINPGPTWHIKGAGDFDGNGEADVLWQDDSGLAAIWLMDGFSMVRGQLVGGFNPGPSWHIKGAGDFDGNGKSDVLWQDDSGLAAIWLMDGTSFVRGQAVGGFNPGPSWHIKGAGDFNGDGKSDILWQHDNGQAAIWLMDGTSFVRGQAVGGNLGSAWDVEGASDLDGNGKSDILWQNDNGQAMAWLMDGSSVVSSADIGSNPGPAWHIDWA